MAKSHEPDTETRDPQGANAAQAIGGEYNYGPKPDPGGEQTTGGLVPPYEGRTESGPAGPTSPSPSPNVSVASAPADEGTGPAHVRGTTRGEDHAKGSSDEELKAHRHGLTDKGPVDPEMPDIPPA